MKLTIVITIDPVKEQHLLQVLVHSLNLQTRQDFDVVFYNQTLREPQQILADLQHSPTFPFRFYNIEARNFFGEYPVWNLYEMMAELVESEEVGDYIMALHLEEFLDADYIESFLDVLETQQLDILMGNLSRTRLDWNSIQPILSTSTSTEFNQCLTELGMDAAPHWSYQKAPSLWPLRATRLAEYFRHRAYFRLRKQFKESARGYTQLPEYLCEDVFAMRTDFARRYNWFLHGKQLFFEDIHICEIKGVCEISRELKKLTRFPVYFNRRKIYHMPHRRFYFQLEDPIFTSGMLSFASDDPVVQSLQKAIRLYQDGTISQHEALVYSRQNANLAGTQNLNYRLHMDSLEAVRDQD